MLTEIYKNNNQFESKNWINKVEAVKQNFPLSTFCSNEVINLSNQPYGKTRKINEYMAYEDYKRR